METEAQKKARLAREKRERQQALAGAGIIVAIIAAIVSALGAGMTSKNRFIRSLCKAIAFVLLAAISIASIYMIIKLIMITTRGY